MEMEHGMRTFVSADSETIVNKQRTDGMKYSIIETISRATPTIGVCEYLYLFKSLMCLFYLKRNESFTFFNRQFHNSMILSCSTFLRNGRKSHSFHCFLVYM